ncbi:MAG TPA: adenylate/guanylate cyclase domain-containing protein [Candidatus Acetothermia bacterium]|nr:adenylate/guanylate cyclase domain-containing protein [Candidatus Acetothermia bacterium]
MSWSTTLKNRQQIRARIDAGEQIAVMFSDIREFTSYTAREGDRAAYELSHIHETILREQIEERDGIVVKTMGDGIMAAFAELSPAVHSAIEIQRAIRQRNAEHPRELIDIGIGLASGTPIMTEADLIGHSVNLSQRVSSLAKGGQILTTKEFAQETLPEKECHYIALGKRELKGLGALHLYEVTWMSEVARLTDRDDNLTLILTDRGTIVAELSKEMHAQIDNAISHLEHGSTDGRLSSLLQRGIARFTRTMIDKSLNAAGIAREQSVDAIDLSIDRDQVVMHAGRKPIRLNGVDIAEAAAFREKMIEMKKKLHGKHAD